MRTASSGRSIQCEIGGGCLTSSAPLITSPVSTSAPVVAVRSEASQEHHPAATLVRFACEEHSTQDWFSNVSHFPSIFHFEAANKINKCHRSSDLDELKRASQASDVGSIPIARSKIRVRPGDIGDRSYRRHRLHFRAKGLFKDCGFSEASGLILRT